MTTASELAPAVHARPATTARYELHGNVAADLCEQLLTVQPPTSSRRFVCYALAGTGTFADLGRAVELEVFGEFFGNDRAEMEREYGPYDRASRFFVVVDRRRRHVAGVLRAVQQSEAGLKTLQDIAGEPLRLPRERVLAHHGITDPDRCWDVGTLAVRAEYRRSALRRGTVALLLYRALYVHAVRAGIEHFVTVMDRHAHRALLGFGIPFVPICGSGSFDYIGSTCTALYGHVPALTAGVADHHRRMRSRRPLAWLFLLGPVRGLAYGHGLDGRLQPALR